MNRTRLVVALALLGPFAWSFSTVLVGNRRFSYRDAAHYYYPLFAWTQAEWKDGVPLWNPQENCGVPLAADNTASVFYPGKLIFALPLDFATSYKLYVTGHLLLAAAAAYGLARRWRASHLAAGICGLSYAFGGAVLILHSNVVYLVGAAWLPLALGTANTMLRKRSLAGALVFGAILALMVLGGDPHTAYHAGLLAAFLALLLWRSERRKGIVSRAEKSATDGSRRVRRRRINRPVLLATAAACGMLLAAIQILPSVQWTRRSNRAIYERPRNVYEIPAHLARPTDQQRNDNTVAGGLLGMPRPGMHHHDIYLFSIGPWRLPELIWPNFSGRNYPTNRRWVKVIPAEGRTWTPTLYMGLLPLLLTAAGFRLRRCATRQRWLSWSLLLGAIGALGWYGLGWLLHEIRCGLFAADRSDVLLGYPVGGLYWLLVTVLPGYAYFRYPAKLLVVAALCASLLAARGWDRVLGRGQTAGSRRAAFVLGIVSLIGSIVVLAIRPWWRDWLEDAAVDNYFGPLETAGAANDLLISLLQATVLCGLLWWLLGRVRANPRWAFVALLLTSVDVALANGWLVASAPQRLFNDTPYAAQRIAAAEKEQAAASNEPFRVFRHLGAGWQPKSWSQTASPDRQQEGLQWDRDTLLPKHHLMNGLSLCASTGSLVSSDLTAFLHFASRHHEVYYSLAARYLILPGSAALGSAERLTEPDSKSSLPANLSLWRNRNTYPRAWIVHDVGTMPPLGSRSPAAIYHRSQDVLFVQEKLRDFRTQAIVESDADYVVATSSLASTRIPKTEACRIVVDRSRHVALEAELSKPGLVVLSDTHYPGWRAHVSADHLTASQGVPILKTNRIMRGVYLPAGRFRIDFHFRPMRFYLGAAISLTAWLALIALATIRALPRKRPTKSAPLSPDS